MCGFDISMVVHICRRIWILSWNFWRPWMVFNTMNVWYIVKLEVLTQNAFFTRSCSADSVFCRVFMYIVLGWIWEWTFYAALLLLLPIGYNNYSDPTNINKSWITRTIWSILKFGIFILLANMLDNRLLLNKYWSAVWTLSKVPHIYLQFLIDTDVQLYQRMLPFWNQNCLLLFLFSDSQQLSDVDKNACKQIFIPGPSLTTKAVKLVS